MPSPVAPRRPPTTALVGAPAAGPASPASAASAASDEFEGSVRVLFESTPLPMWVVDLETLRYLAVNPAAVAHYGYSQAEFLAMSVQDLQLPGAGDAISRFIDEHRDSPTVSRTTRHRRKDGAAVEMELVAHTFPFRGRRCRLVIAKDVTAQHRIERALRAGERELRAQFMATPVPIYSWRADGDDFELVGYNHAALDMTDGRIVEWIGSRASEMFAGVTADYLGSMRECLRRGESIHLQVPHRLLTTGIEKDLLVTFIPVQPDQVLIHTVDETERRRAERSLRASEERFRALIENASELVAVLDATGAFQFASASYARLLGHDPAALIGASALDILHPDDARASGGALAAVLASPGDVRTLMVRARHADGRLRTIEFAVQNLLDHPAVRGIVCNGRDVTDRQAAEAELRFRSQLLDTVEQAVIATTIDGRITYWNRFAERLYGWSAAEALGRVITDVTPSHATRDQAEALMARLADGESWSGEFDVQARDGRRFPAHVTDTPIRDAEGRLVGIVGISSDVSERRELEEQFRQSQKLEAVGKLAGGVAHDFNNLLTVIAVHASFLLEALPAGHALREDAEAIHRAGQRAAGLTRQLLAFSRKQLLKPRAIDLNALVDETRRMLERLIGVEIRIVTDLAPDAGSILADPCQVDQVLVNLAVNARDAMPDGGRLTIRTRGVTVGDEHAAARRAIPAGDWVLLEVADDGIGMDAATQARLFEPFFTTKAPGQGTGLGLATVYGIVRQSGGYVLVESAPGEGTTFRVYLPRAAAASEPTPHGIDAVPVPGTETVLLVEDEPAVREIARRALRRQGYAVLEAADGEEALARSASFPGAIHLVVSDAAMPGLTGAETVRRLRAQRPGLGVVFMSGYTDDEVLRRGIVSSTVPFIQKPFEAADLVRLVRETLDARQDTR